MSLFPGIATPVPKPKRVRSRTTVERVRKRFCERCGCPAHGEPHHIRSKGSPGPGDIPENLIQLCARCHEAAQRYEIPREDLILLVAARERLDAQEVKYRIGMEVRRERLGNDVA